MKRNEQGPEILEMEILHRLPGVVKPSTFTQPGQEPRHIKAVLASDLARAVFGINVTRTQNASLRRTLNSLARSGKVGLLYMYAVGARGPRAVLAVELINNKLENA
jgi:hypothetical protein